MTNHTYYEVCDNGEDGRGPTTVVARFAHEADAEKAKDPTWHSVRTVNVTVYDSFDDYQQNRPDAVRKRALAKLSPEERRVLGLN